MTQTIAFICLLSYLSLDLGSAMLNNEVGPGVQDYCPPQKTICEFYWSVSRRQTMMHYDGLIGSPIIYRNGAFYKRTNCSTGMVPINSTELSKVFTVDGDTFKYLTVVEGQFPGPSVVVYEGQQVVVHVENKLINEGTSIHWHGLKMMDTNWMDGVSGVTQCPINPHETFTYRFFAKPAGTHVYHSHHGVQRADGFYGAFIVLPKPDTPKPPSQPNFTTDFMMLVSDLDAGQASMAYQSFLNGMKQYLWDGWNTTDQCFGGSTKAPNGVSAATFRFHAGLINGKGWRFDANNQPVVEAPLETFNVTQGGVYRFRVINVATAYAFKISVDNHPLTLIATDSNPINPVQVDSFIVNSGERFDFYITANQSVQNYWIRAETIEYIPHKTVAVLHYSGASTTAYPTTSPTCMGTSCVIVNCPFESFLRGPEVGSTCLNLEKLTSTDMSKINPSNPFKEMFVSFEKTATVYNRRLDVANGIKFILPSTPPAVIGTAKYDHDCRKMPRCGGSTPCECTNQVTIPLGYTVQVVLLANTTHPIHLHGHYFEVIKIAYPPPQYNNVTFVSLMMNQDIICNDALCSQPRWRNPAWNNGNVPGTNTDQPVLKDTVTIPAGGYVVIRFTTDNPGWWLMHCHIETHFLQGMGILLQTGYDWDMRPAPLGFPCCGSYRTSQEDFLAAMNGRWFIPMPPPSTAPLAVSPKSALLASALLTVALMVAY